MSASQLTWDVFCRVIDNHGDLGVCWRLARELAARGHEVRLWVDDASALDWMAPGAVHGQVGGVQVFPWAAASDEALLAGRPRADVWLEAFGCELPAAFVGHGARVTARGRLAPVVWINLEYLSAEPWVERMHGLPSPVLHGPAAGWTKWFFYPGFTPRTGGLLHERDLPARQAAFDRAGWLAAQGVPWCGERLISLFCYEPPGLGALLEHLRRAPEPVRLLVTAGRAAQAVRGLLSDQNTGLGLMEKPKPLSISYLPRLPQTAYDELLWTCDLNFVRGEDSLVRALWAGRAFVWQPYPQDDDAHRAKLEAFLDWLQAPAALRAFHRAWSGVDAVALPEPDVAAWSACALDARARLRSQDELASSLVGFVLQKR